MNGLIDAKREDGANGTLGTAQLSTSNFVWIDENIGIHSFLLCQFVKTHDVSSKLLFRGRIWQVSNARLLAPHESPALRLTCK